MIMTKRLTFSKSKRLKENVELIWFTAPVLIAVFISIGIPFFMNVILSLMDWNGISKTREFIGFANYIELFTTDSDALSSMFFTFKVAILHIILSNVVALLLAIILDMKLFSRNFLRAAFYLPQVISMVIIGFIWKFTFSMAFESFFKASGLNFLEWSWLGNSKLAFWAIVTMSVWQSIGFFMVIYIAGLQTIPGELMEASAIDGANGVKRFFHITLPLMIPSIASNVFFATLGALKHFDMILTLTNGGPGKSTSTMALDIYTEAFLNNRYGYGVAKSVVFFIIVLIITRIEINLFKSREVSL